jgi:hypothetical protein
MYGDIFDEKETFGRLPAGPPFGLEIGIRCCMQCRCFKKAKGSQNGPKGLLPVVVK